jgi:uncharacterized protein YxeA
MFIGVKYIFNINMKWFNPINKILVLIICLMIVIIISQFFSNVTEGYTMPTIMNDSKVKKIVIWNESWERLLLGGITIYNEDGKEMVDEFKITSEKGAYSGFGSLYSISNLSDGKHNTFFYSSQRNDTLTITLNIPEYITKIVLTENRSPYYKMSIFDENNTKLSESEQYLEYGYGIYEYNIIYKGSKGYQGDAGEPGPTGKPGPTGAPGIVGSKGLDGKDGQPGEPGEPGQPGQQGPQGPQGKQGDKGSQGEKGDKGSLGDKGSIGPEGAQGPEGPQGPQGPQGDKGPDAAGSSIQSTYETFTFMNNHPMFSIY